MSNLSKKTAAIFGHPNPYNSGLLKVILEEEGFDLTLIKTTETNLKEFDALKPDLLLVMGGLIGVYQADDFPFLNDEIEIIKKRIAKDKPTLGICLGSQLIAAALGAEVHKGIHGPEKGWHDIMINEEGLKTSLRHFSCEHTKMFQWHQDTFSFPHGATLLASSETYKHQAFQYGKNIWALQFHPEVTPERSREYEIALICHLTCEESDFTLHELRSSSARYIDKANKQTRKFFLEWFKEVGL